MSDEDKASKFSFKRISVAVMVYVCRKDKHAMNIVDRNAMPIRILFCFSFITRLFVLEFFLL